MAVKQINYILRNEVYVGDRKLQKKSPKNYLTKKPDANIEKRSYYLKDIHEGIVDRALWERVQAQLGKPLTVVATGGLAPYITPCCQFPVQYDADLLFKGLALLWEKNQ